MKSSILSKSLRRNLMQWLMVFVLLFSLVAAAVVWTETSEVQAQPNIWYVDSFKMISGDGESWGTAFKTIQEAIDAATGSDEIWVRAGTYEISSPIVLDLWDDEAIYGGFAGWETSRDQRNWKNNKTIIDGKHSLADYLIKITQAAPTIDGFTITGAGTGVAESGGSAMSVFGCGGLTPYINNCTFVGNWAHGWDRGGAMTIHSSSPWVTNCVFYGNRSDYWGGAIFNGSYSNTIFTNCTFTGNHCKNGGGALVNSAVSPADYPYPAFVNCILWGDTATSGAAEIQNDTNPSLHYNNDINQSGYAGVNGNISQDPLFRSASGNIGLRPGSPCIDTGTNTATSQLPTDYEGDPRIIDGDENGTDIIDIGADEFDPDALFGVWYVNGAVGSSGDGTSWGQAFKTIGEATGGALLGEEVWVAQGIYNLAGQINVPTGIGIYGGFVGGETNWGQRNWVNNVTTVNGQNAVGTLFYVGMGATGEVTIDGFTITGATSYAIFKQNDQALLTVENCIITGNTGIGLVSYYFNTTVNNCTFSDNTGLNYAGAAIKHTGGQPNPSTLIISNSTFTNNRTLHSEQGNGGAIAIGYSTVNMSNCTFSDNSSVRIGGAIYNDTSAAYTVTINDCTFSGNTSGHAPNFKGGAIYSNGPLIINGGEFTGNEAGTYGGAIHCNAPLTANGVTFSGNHGLGRNAIDCTSTTTLTDCQFIGNTPSGTAGTGGAVVNSGTAPLVIDHCTFSGNSAGTTGGSAGAVYKSLGSLTITDSMFLGNSCYRDGGAIYMSSTMADFTNCVFAGNSSTFAGDGVLRISNCETTITNCTFSGNTAGEHGSGGVINTGGGTLTLTNSILWGDSDPSGDANEIYNQSGTPTVLDVTYCDIDQEEYGELDGSADANGNIRLDPLFMDTTPVDPATWDLHLQEGSPCINTGTAVGAPDHDIEGTMRPRGSGFDMGAYESAVVTYTLNTSASPAQGGSVSGGGPYGEGETATVEAIPAGPCWVFTNWSGDLSGTDNPTTILMNGDKSVTANFSSVGPVTLSTYTDPAEGGSVTGGGSYDCGDTATVEAIPADACWRFIGWTGNLGGTDNPTTILMNGDRSVTAHFAKYVYNLTTNASPPEGGSVTGTGTYYCGDMATVEAIPTDACWEFIEWSGALSGTQNPTTILMDGDKSVTANFAKIQYTLNTNASPPEGGSVTGGGTYDCGDTAQVEAIPADACWEFTGWSGALSGTQNPTDLLMDGNKSVTANFAKIQYTLTVTADPVEGGTVTGDGTHDCCTDVEVEAIPADACWEFTGWSGALGGSENPTTIHIDDDKTVTANFAKIQYTLTVTADPVEGGTVTGGGTYDCGDTATVEATPESGWVFTGWSGDLSGTDNPTTLLIDGDKTVTANFAEDDDSDGVPDTEEQGPDGTDSDYDGNGDGTPDSQQDNVASLHTHDGQDYVTIASPSGTTMTDAQAVDNPSPEDAPTNWDFPYGFFDFTINGVGTGGATTVTLHLPGDASVTTYYKYGPTPSDPTPHWYEFLYDGTTGAEISGNIITLHFVDGERGDNDLTANGTIVEPGGPGLPGAPPTPPGPGGGTGTWFGPPSEPSPPEPPEEPEPAPPAPTPPPAPPPAPGEPADEGPAGLAPGAWAGIGIGAALLVALVVWLILRRRLPARGS